MYMREKKFMRKRTRREKSVLKNIMKKREKKINIKMGMMRKMMICTKRMKMKKHKMNTSRMRMDIGPSRKSYRKNHNKNSKTRNVVSLVQKRAES